MQQQQRADRWDHAPRMPARLASGLSVSGLGGGHRNSILSQAKIVLVDPEAEIHTEYVRTMLMLVLCCPYSVL